MSCGVKVGKGGGVGGVEFGTGGGEGGERGGQVWGLGREGDHAVLMVRIVGRGGRRGGG